MASIRPRRDSDIPACVEILKAVYAMNGFPVGGVDDALNELQTDDQAWVAADSNDGAIIGHVALNKARESYIHVTLWRERHPETDVAVLARLFVHPEARKRGAATKLVRAVEEEARSKGLRLLLLALVKDQDAIRLYRSLGWENYGTTIYRWGEGNEMAGECFVSPLP